MMIYPLKMVISQFTTLNHRRKYPMNPQEARFAYALRGADVARVAEGVDALFADQLDRTVQKVAIPISPVRIEADGCGC
jgi:hypothetical protein